MAFQEIQGLEDFKVRVGVLATLFEKGIIEVPNSLSTDNDEYLHTYIQDLKELVEAGLASEMPRNQETAFAAGLTQKGKHVYHSIMNTTLSIKTTYSFSFYSQR